MLAASAWCQTSTPTTPTPTPKTTVPFKIAAVPVTSGTATVSSYAIKWNTATGQVWLLAVSNPNLLGPKSAGVRGQSAINTAPLADGSVLGRFSVKVLDNYQTIVMLDEIGGNAWLITVSSPTNVSFTHLDDLQ